MQDRGRKDDAIWLRLLRERLDAQGKRIETHPGAELDCDFDHLELLIDEPAPADGANSYYERAPAEKRNRRTLDDMRRLSEEIKRRQRERS